MSLVCFRQRRLTALMCDPRYWRDRDPAVIVDVHRLWRQVHGDPLSTERDAFWSAVRAGWPSLAAFVALVVGLLALSGCGILNDMASLLNVGGG